MFLPQKTINKEAEMLVDMSKLSLNEKEGIQSVEASFSEYWEDFDITFSSSESKKLSDNVDVWFDWLSCLVYFGTIGISRNIVNALINSSTFEQLSCSGLNPEGINFSVRNKQLLFTENWKKEKIEEVTYGLYSRLLKNQIIKKVLFKAVDNLSLQRKDDLVERLYSLYPEGQKPGVIEGLHPAMQLFIIREGRYDFSGESSPACLIRYDEFSSLRCYGRYFVDGDCSRDPMYGEMEEEAIGLYSVETVTIHQKRTLMMVDYFRNMLKCIKPSFIFHFKKEIKRFLSKLYVRDDVDLDMNELKDIFISYGDIMETKKCINIQNYNESIDFDVKQRKRPISIQNVNYDPKIIDPCELLIKHEKLIDLSSSNRESSLEDWIKGANDLWQFTKNLSIKQMNSLIFNRQINETLTLLVKEEFMHLFRNEHLKYVNAQLENADDEVQAPLPSIYESYIDKDIDPYEYESDIDDELEYMRDDIYGIITHSNVSLYPSSLFDVSDSSNAIRVVIR